MGNAVSQAEEAVAAFHRRLTGAGQYSARDVALVCTAATHPDQPTREAASRIFFSGLVEPLSDAFDSTLVTFCDRVVAQAATYCASLDAGAVLRDTLRRLGAASEGALLRRASRVRSQANSGVIGPEVRKVLLLSRVTWGADVAITSVFLSQLREHYPQAELVLLGSDDLKELFGGDRGLRLRPTPYPRQGTLLERLLSWPALANVVEEETTGLPPHQWVVIDPESRLSQLGMLPLVTDESRYLLFPSRGYPKESTESLGTLAARWIGDACGSQRHPLPYVAPAGESRARAALLLGCLRSHDTAPVVAVNFAVGANPQKRLGDAFEEGLLRGILQLESRVVLASGSEEADVARARGLAERLRGDGTRVAAASDAATGITAPTEAVPQLLLWEGSLGGFAALIAGSDTFLGYDSACTHIAAAQGVPTLDIFGWHPNDTFVQRWTPYGAGRVRVVLPTKGRSPAQAVEEVLAALRELLSAEYSRGSRPSQAPQQG